MLKVTIVKKLKKVTILQKFKWYASQLQTGHSAAQLRQFIAVHS